MRKFAVAKGYEGKGVNLPKRATKNAAGYDFEAIEDVVIPSIWSSSSRKRRKVGQPDIVAGTYVHTGVKAYMGTEEFLGLYSRSSNYNKKGLILANSVGVGDADYVDNPDNDGELIFNFINFGFDDVLIKKGERIGQGIFQPFLKTDDDESEAERNGGFGSTNTP